MYGNGVAFGCVLSMNKASIPHGWTQCETEADKEDDWTLQLLFYSAVTADIGLHACADQRKNTAQLLGVRAIELAG